MSNSLYLNIVYIFYGNWPPNDVSGTCHSRCRRCTHGGCGSQIGGERGNVWPEACSSTKTNCWGGGWHVCSHTLLSWAVWLQDRPSTASRWVHQQDSVATSCVRKACKSATTVRLPVMYMQNVRPHEDTPNPALPISMSDQDSTWCAYIGLFFFIFGLFASSLLKYYYIFLLYFICSFWEYS